MQLRRPNVFLGLWGQTFTNSKIPDFSMHELDLYTGKKIPNQLRGTESSRGGS